MGEWGSITLTLTLTPVMLPKCGAQLPRWQQAVWVVVLCVLLSSVLPAAALRRTEFDTDGPDGQSEQHQPTPPVSRSLSWPLGLLLYGVLVQGTGRVWSFIRDNAALQKIKALKLRARSAEKLAKANNMPDTIVKSFKYEREALKLNKQIDALEGEIRAAASTPASRSLSFSTTYVFPVLPLAIWGNACLFCLGEDWMLWPLGWVLSPSGDVCGKGCVGLIPWSILCSSAAHYILTFLQ